MKIIQRKEHYSLWQPATPSCLAVSDITEKRTRNGEKKTMATINPLMLTLP